jgi:predicted  nucleic acid-binding Zn-ribbon protein
MRFAAVLAVVVVHSLAVVAAADAAAQEAVDERACARLLPEIDKLEAMLTRETKTRPTDTEAQRMQLVATVLGLRYHNIESLQSSVRAAESEENDVRGAVAKARAQLDALDEAVKNTSGAEPNPQYKSQKTEIEVNLKGLEERVKGLQDRRSNVQAQVFVERHEIDKLEAIVRRWIDESP